jgi:hypothetical protein
MSLSAWEQQVLNSIKDGLADSDPDLATLLTTFTELASGEEVPALEKIRVSSLRMIQRSRRYTRRHSRARLCRYARRVRWHLSVWYAGLLWLLVTAALIGVALALSRGGGQAACTGSWSTLCAHSIPTPSSSLVSHGVAVHHLGG